MKKVLSLVAILCMALVFFAGCDFVSESTTTKAPCEHNWVDATCEAPKTCSVCGVTEGEALGHNPIEVFGQAPTCTEPGQTNFVYCDVCDKNLSEAKEIAPLGHTEETVAGKAPTCTEAGLTDGKKCSVCGETTVEQTAIDALGHKAGEDDGDVTTAVTCERCDYVFVEAKEAITLTIPEFANGAVIADKMNYAIGDTVKLTVNPDWEYAQKLYINDKALILDWNNNVYTFVAEKDTYVISGTFEKGLDIKAYDPTRWNTMNIAHGVVTTYYPGQPDSWWFDLNGNYQSLEIIAKNYLPLEESMDNQQSEPKVDGYHSVIRMTLSNGKHYAFRLYNDKGTYAVSCTAVSGSVTGWGNWKNVENLLGYSINDAMAGEGVKFKLERTAANVITVSVNDVVMFTYTMDGVTAEDKITAVGFQHNRNAGQYVDIPFAVTEACEHTWVDATCTAPKTCSKCQMTIGEKIEHDYDDGVVTKASTCTEAGVKTFTCSCGDSYTEEIPAGHKNEDGDLICDSCGANLCQEHDAEDDGNCMTEVKCTKCGEILVAASSDHTPEADDGDVTTEVKCANAGCEQILVPAKEAITLVIPTLENGTITADKKNYAVGDTVTLTIAPAKDYAQKLYINGASILVDANSKYSFVVEAGKIYEITGEFVNVQGAWYWTAEYIVLNQAHGVFHSPVPAGGEKNGELVPAADKYCGGKVLVKDPSHGTKQDFAIVLKMTFSDGQKAEVRLVNKDGKGHYMIQSMSGMFGSWKWYYDLNDEENAAVANGEGVWFGLVRYGTDIELSLNGKVLPHRADTPISLAETTVLNQFKVTTFNFTYAIDVQYEFYLNGQAPVKPEPPVDEDDEIISIGEFANGTVTADKDSYEVGDTVTLTIAPAKDYAQKLYINGQPILVDTNSKYSFVIEEGKTYDITGEFVNVKGDWYWTAEYGMLNQAHGVFHSPVPAGGEKNGELVPTADKCYGGKVLVKDPSNGTKQDFAIVLKMHFSDGQKAELRLVNKDGKGHYMIQSMSGMFGSWKWYYDLNDEENAAVANGEGVWFELVRDGSNIDIKLNGKVISHRADTPISLAENTVLNQFKVTTYNYSYAIDVKYEFYIAE